MTDEERKQFIEFLRYYRESSEYGKTWADKAADEIERLAAALAQSDAEPVQAFAKAVLHGDDEHKAWLLEAAGAFIAGNPLPAPRGKGAAPPRPDASAGLIEAAEMAEKEAPGWSISDGMIVLQQFARKLRARAAAKSTPTWTGKGPMPDDVQGWPDRSAPTDEADEDKPLGFRTNDVPNPYAEEPVPSWYETHDDKDVMPDKWSMPDASAGLIEAAEILETDSHYSGSDASRWLQEAANILRARAADRGGK
jgi:hypothetical protein